MKNKYVYCAVFFLLIASFITYGRILENGFINYDDPTYITENTHIKSGFNSESTKWAFSTFTLFYWHPLTWLSHILDWGLFGANASGHHFVNLILHIGSVLLLFLFLNRTTKAVWPSLFAAAFFALHPLRVESVAWASERKDVLSMFFGMGSIYLYALYVEKSKGSTYIFCLVFFALSLMAKPMTVTLPFVLLLLDYWPLNRRSKGIVLKEKVPFFVLSGAICTLTFLGQNRFGVVVPLDQWPISGRVFNAVITYVAYIGKTFWPVDLAIFYPFEQTFIVQQIFNYFFFLAVITILVLYYTHQMPFLFVGWFWYLGTLMPMIGLIQVASQSMADRFTYLPSIGIAIILAWGAAFVIHQEKIKKTVLLPLGGAVLAILALLTWKQCGYWQNSTSLFRHTLHVTKKNAQAHNNLGLALFQEGNVYGATYHYSKAINIQPDALGYFNRGLAYASINHMDQAINDFTKVIDQKSDCTAYYNRGIAYFKTGDHQKAMADFSHAILLNSDYAEAYNNRGNIYGQLGQYRSAIEDFNKAIISRPCFVQAYNNRAKAYLKQGNIDRGCPDARKACSLGDCRILESTKSTGQCR